MPYFKFTLILLLFLIQLSCHFTKNNQPLYWPSAEWLCQNNSSKYIESWKKQDSNHYLGFAQFYKNDSLLFQEEMNLIETDSGIYFMVKVSNQNQQKYIPFKLIKNDNSEYEFENKKHDYPQNIKYHYKSDDSLIVQISGKRENGNPIQTYRFCKSTN